MQTHSFDPVEIRSTIKWYFESKNVSLRKALQIRGPLSADQHNDLRVFYSQYLTSLVSGVEALLEKEYPFYAEFRDELYGEFVLEGHSNGEQNYAYLRELRNSIVHRGEDIAGRGTLTPQGIHLLYVPRTITTRNGKTTYASFSPLLLGVAAACESFIGRLILQHFQKRDLLRPRTDRAAWLEGIQSRTDIDPRIPQWVKQQLPNTLQAINFQQVEAESIESVVRLLSTENQELISVMHELQGAHENA